MYKYTFSFIVVEKNFKTLQIEPMYFIETLF